MNNFNNYQRNANFAPFYSATSTSPLASASTNNIVQVQGIEGAKAWQLAPNSMIILLDSEADGKMYIKVSDNIGMSTLRIFDYVEEVPSTMTSGVTVNNDLDLSQYVRKDELSTLIKELTKEHEQSISTVTAAGPEPSVASPGPASKVTILKKQ